LAAAWMARAAVRAVAVSTRAPEDRSAVRRSLSFAAVLAAAIASIATAPAPPPPPPQPPPPPPPPPPLQTPVAVAEDPSCADLTVDTCERTATQTLVVVRARAKSYGNCTIDVLSSEEASSQGRTAADILPKNLVVRSGESKTFALTFLRSVQAGERNGSLRA